jgi:hypothetical protein
MWCRALPEHAEYSFNFNAFVTFVSLVVKDTEHPPPQRFTRQRRLYLFCIEKWEKIDAGN